MPSEPPHILIAGPTASGKSALALALAEREGGWIVNADALQVYDGWSVLTARPPAEDLARAPHHLYGHVPRAHSYSVGDWLREVAALLDRARQTRERLIVVGGTGLYFRALCEGLAEIPATDPAIRQAANARREAEGTAPFLADLAARDPETLSGIDRNNPMRVQRAWEVLEQTGKGLSAWQATTPPPLLAQGQAHRLVLTPEVPWLNARIATRFEQMLDLGAREEVAAVLREGWDPTLPSSKALGAADLIAAHRSEITEADAVARAVTATRQFAKRQRTWFRARMADWTRLPLDEATELEDLLSAVPRRDAPSRM
ncbi:MAG: tRNA (adenosine(37)-N6)-dimethylallyltransferase MiaA [Pseudomonadota bacterium]